MNNTEFDVHEYLKENEKMNIRLSDICRSLTESGRRGFTESGASRSSKEPTQKSAIKTNIHNWIVERERKNNIKSNLQDRLDQHERIAVANSVGDDRTLLSATNEKHGLLKESSE
jgi:hypothetical protein